MVIWKDVTADEARDKLDEMVDEVVVDSGIGYHITVDGRPVAVLVSSAEYESLKTAAEVFSDPDAMRRYVERWNGLNKGDILSTDEFGTMARRASRLPDEAEGD